MLRLRPSFPHNIQTLLWIWIYYYFFICFPKALPSRAFERFTELSNGNFTVLMVSSFHQGDDEAQKDIKNYLLILDAESEMPWAWSVCLLVFSQYSAQYRACYVYVHLRRRCRHQPFCQWDTRSRTKNPEKGNMQVKLHLHLQTKEALHISSNTAP